MRSAAIEVTLDEHLLRRLLDNLLANALCHSGGTKVLLAARRHAGLVELWMIDDGRGVPAEDTDRLFDDYF